MKVVKYDNSKILVAKHNIYLSLNSYVLCCLLRIPLYILLVVRAIQMELSSARTVLISRGKEKRKYPKIFTQKIYISILLALYWLSVQVLALKQATTNLRGPQSESCNGQYRLGWLCSRFFQKGGERTELSVSLTLQKQRT